MAVENWNEMKKKIEKEAKDFLWENYKMHLEIPIEINGRLKRVYGRFIYKISQKKSVRIEFSKNYIENQEWSIVRETIIHECIHYALYEMDLPFKDGCEEFENELIKHGSHSANTIPYKGKVVQYGCEGCHKIFSKKKRYPKNVRYISNCCSLPIKYIGEKII